MGALPFKFEVPAAVWFDKSAPAGQRRRIAGVISSENLDRQDEILVQKGLDFTPFIQHGWFNDNHSRDTDGIVGHPDSVKFFQKGQKLPNGEVAASNCHWSEGYLLENQQRADRIWETAQALHKAGNRRLGFSVEGKVEKRTGPNRNVVAKAKIQNVAITNCPVNTDTRLEVLAKSLAAVELAEDDVFKGLTAGTGAGEGRTHEAGSGPVEGEGAGQVLAPESLEGRQRKELEDDEDQDDTKKSFNKSEAMVWLRDRMLAKGLKPDAETIARYVQGIFSLKER